MYKTHLKKVLFLLLFFTLTNSYAQILPKWTLIQPKYDTSDAFVAGFNVMDYGADPTGVADQTALFQQLLDSLGSRSINKGTRWNNVPNGGTLYVPEGKYLLRGSLTLPKGVTIRGDWEKPVKGQPVKGTILMSDNPNARGKDVEELTANEALSFITLQPSSAVKNVNIWYPSQDANNIVAYPPAILLGQQGYWGNDYATVVNITLVNAYDGVVVSRRNGGGAPNCHGIYGTPLKRGIEIDNIAEVGRVDNVDFSPDYWAGSGLPGSPSINGQHKKYMEENATAIVLRRIDWSFVGKVKAEGFKIGQRFDLSFNPDNQGNRTSPNGHNYSMEFTNCKYGVYIVAVSGAGLMFYDYSFDNCEYGFYFEGSPGGTVQIQGCGFNAKSASLYASNTNNTKILINQSVINNGPVDIRGGLASIVNCDFNNNPDQIILGQNARAIITGNRFKKEVSVRNVSFYECIIDHDPIEMTSLPDFPYKNQYDFVQKPAGSAFYVATENGVSVGAYDNSDALQALLDQTKNDGGGLVFLPPGHYNFRKPIRIPAGVELKGSVDNPTTPMGAGTAMEIYAGRGEDEAGTPFISMDPGSGIRGLVMNYPEQVIQLITEPGRNGGDVYHYPYTIRGNKDVYIVNIALRACYHGIDLFTNKCDNHFVDYLAGHVFKTGIRVGGGSKGGHIYNAQFNQIAYAYGGETKFGAWPNSPVVDQSNPNRTTEIGAAYAYSWNHLDFLILEDCEDQVMFNNFNFGSNRGFILTSNNGKGPQGISLGQGIDAGMKAFYIGNVGEKGFNFINTQIVTTAPGSTGEVQQTYKDNNRYIQVDQNFTKKVTFFGADFWGQPQNIAVEVLNGTIELQAGNFSNSGQRTFTSIRTGAMLDIIGTNVNPINTLLTNGSEPGLYMQSSIVNTRSVNIQSCGLWFNNLEHTASTSPNSGAFLPRTGWIATASIYNDNAMLSLDGDINSHWSTIFAQQSGQWFMVDMQTEQTFTGVYMETVNTYYNPVSFRVLISSNGTDWTEVANEKNTNHSNFDKQNARYIKIEITGSSTNPCRIYEFYVANTYIPPYTGINIISQEENIRVWFSPDGQILSSGTTGTSTVRIYAINGQQLIPEFHFEKSASVNLPIGIYIVRIQNNGRIYTRKLIKN